MKKVAYLLLLIVVIIAPLLFYGCQEPECDGYNAEPRISLNYELSDSITQIIVLNEPNAVIEFYPNYITLPIDMNSQQMVYEIETTSGTELLEFTYTTKVTVKKADCGAQIHLEDISIGLQTTFENVIVEEDFYYRNISITIY